jgi:dynein heavy chain
VQERRKYGALGWNIMYDFMDGDLGAALQTLRILLGPGQQQAQRGGADGLPWAALRYVTGQINYGGRVTDDNDRRLLMALLERHYSPATLEAGYNPFLPPGSSGSPSAGGVPDSSDASAYVSYIQALPATDRPELLGLHANADVTFQLQDSARMVGPGSPLSAPQISLLQ